MLPPLRYFSEILFYIQILACKLGFAGDIHAHLAHNAHIRIVEHTRAVRFQTAQSGQHVESRLRQGIGCGAYAERGKNVVQIQFILVRPEHVLFQTLDRFQNEGQEQKHIVGNARKRLYGVEHARGTRRHEGGGSARDESAVLQLDCHGRKRSRRWCVFISAPTAIHRKIRS